MTFWVVVKNVFELFPGGLEAAMQDFERAWQWAGSYSFSSFQTHAYGARSPIIDHKRLADLGIQHGASFKKLARDMLFAHVARREEYAGLLIEGW